MLEQAIVDASALREAAIQSAEQAVIEKYSTEIRETVENLMESDDLNESKSVDEQITEADETGEGYAFVEGTELSDLEEHELLEIDVKGLFEQLEKQRLEESEEIIEIIEEENELEEEVELEEEAKPKEALEESEESLEEETELEEAIEFDFDPVPEGNTEAYGATNAQQKEQAMLIDVMQQIENANEKLEKKNEGLIKDKNSLVKSNKKLKESVGKLAQKFEEMKLMNAKLFYTNKTLMDASLNERQKHKLVESINNAQSYEQAKIVYETLQSTVGNVSNKEQPESLSEAVGKRSSTSLLLKARKQDDEPKVSESNNLFATRMQALAGIKNL
tara:strand:- start:313 stop:1311 length:999 start_codon:yes stop_codon:yes gene_type:complete